MIALGLWVWVPSASSESNLPVEGPAQYLPIQSFSYNFGSKFVSGYFTQQGYRCFVTLMVTEKSDPEGMLPPSPTRVRLVLNPAQIAGLDSEEGRSLNFTCGEGATTLFVDVGERDALVNLQASASLKKPLL